MRRIVAAYHVALHGAHDGCIATHGAGQQYRQLIDRCVNIILPSHIPVISFLFYCKWASSLIALLSVLLP